VALFGDAAEFPVDAEMAAIIEGAAARLVGEGAQIEEARPQVDFRSAVETYLELLMPLNTRFQTEEEFQGLATLVAALPEDDPDLLLRSLRAQAATHRSWLSSHEDREVMRRQWARFFERWDVLLCPVTLTPAIEHDDRPFPERRLRVNGAERPYLEQIAWPGLITMALLPSTVIPLGRTGAGLPVGVQIVGPHLEDRTPLAFARQAEAVLGGFAPPDGFGAPRVSS
jgi:amidase